MEALRSSIGKGGGKTKAAAPKKSRRKTRRPNSRKAA